MYQQEKPTPFIAMNARQLLGAIAAGGIVGLLNWGLVLLLDAYVFKAVFCSSPLSAQCVSSNQYAVVAAMILALILGVFLLVKLQVFRPLLVGASTAVSLWGLMALIASFPVYMAAISFVLLFAAAYGLFTWLARIRSFGMAFITMVVIVVAVRFVLNS